MKLEPEDLERLITWMDTYAQCLGSFSPDQERRLLDLRKRHTGLLIEREGRRTAAGDALSAGPAALPRGQWHPAVFPRE